MVLIKSHLSVTLKKKSGAPKKINFYKNWIEKFLEGVSKNIAASIPCNKSFCYLFFDLILLNILMMKCLLILSVKELHLSRKATYNLFIKSDNFFVIESYLLTNIIFKLIYIIKLFKFTIFFILL